MPGEAQFNEWWLWASTVTFLAKGGIFAVLAWQIIQEHRKALVKPSDLGSGLVHFFLATSVGSVVLAAIFGLALWALLHEPVDVAIRMAARAAILATAWTVVATGVRVVRAVKAEARRRERGEAW